MYELSSHSHSPVLSTDISLFVAKLVIRKDVMKICATIRLNCYYFCKIKDEENRNVVQNIEIFIYIGKKSFNIREKDDDNNKSPMTVNKIISKKTWSSDAFIKRFNYQLTDPI